MYREFNLKLGRTGAGLKYSEIEPGSAIYNLIGKLYVCKFSISLTVVQLPLLNALLATRP